MTWVMAIGGVFLLFVVAMAALARTDPMRPRTQELRGRSRDQLANQIDRILMVNRSVEPRTRMGVSATLTAFPSPTWRPGPAGATERRMTLLPNVLHEAYYGAPGARLDDDDLRALLLDASEALASSSFVARSELRQVAELYEGDAREAPLLEGDVPYEPGDRVLSLLLTLASQGLGAGLSAEEIRAWWSLGAEPMSEAARAKLEAFDRRVEEELLQAVEQHEEILAGEAGARLEIEALRPRFLTPERVARRQALLEQVAQHSDVDIAAIEAPERLVFPVDGLPHPIELVLDLGTHVSPVHSTDLDGGEHTPEELRERALTNLAADGALPAIPDDRVEIFEDPSDHGAACLLLLPQTMPPGRSCLAVSPGHDLLLLFPDRPELIAEARARFDELAQDAPVPEPVRVSSEGFEPVGWPS